MMYVNILFPFSLKIFVIKYKIKIKGILKRKVKKMPPILFVTKIFVNISKYKTKTYSFSEPLIYEKNMIEAINTELLENKFNNNICHGSDAIETYRIIDLILNDFYNGRNREFWKNQ